MLAPPRGVPLRIAASAFQAKARRLNVAGSRPVSRSKSHFVLGTTLGLVLLRSE
jgi:hypothetical protein